MSETETSFDAGPGVSRKKSSLARLIMIGTLLALAGALASLIIPMAVSSMEVPNRAYQFGELDKEFVVRQWDAVSEFVRPHPHYNSGVYARHGDRGRAFGRYRVSFKGLNDSPRPGRNETVFRFIRLGWPRYSFERTEVEYCKPGATASRVVSQFPQGHLSTTPDITLTARSATRPKWGGLFLNALLFAGVAFVPWLLLVLVSRWRSRQRIIRGSCPKCGYPKRTESELCPECGALVPDRSTLRSFTIAVENVLFRYYPSLLAAAAFSNVAAWLVTGSQVRHWIQPFIALWTFLLVGATIHLIEASLSAPKNRRVLRMGVIGTAVSLIALVIQIVASVAIRIP